jgi:hypothetical protein
MNRTQDASEPLPASDLFVPVVAAGDFVMSRRVGVLSSSEPISDGVRDWITLPDKPQLGCKSSDRDL